MNHTTRKLLSAASLLTLTSIAQAGDYTVRVEASLVSIDGLGSAVAPFSAGQVGDTMIVEYAVTYPGTPEPEILNVNGSPVPGIQYELDYADSTLTFRGQQLPLIDTVPPPYEDGLSLSSDVNGVFGYTGVSVGFLSITCWDLFIFSAPGTLLPSSDIVEAAGTSYDPSMFFSPWLVYSDQFAISADSLWFAITNITVNAPVGSIGTPFCQATPNSTGGPGSITATGSAVVADNDVLLSASDLPPNTFGFFLASRSQGTSAQPGGSQGILCLGGSIGRFVGPGQVLNSGSDGEFGLSIDLTSMPQPSGAVAVAAGETWNFTAWHRDILGGSVTSNFTNGVAVSFN